MKRRTIKSILARLALGILLSMSLFSVWYAVAANYNYGALAGTYVFHGKGETCTLYLHRNRTLCKSLVVPAKFKSHRGGGIAMVSRTFPFPVNS